MTDTQTVDQPEAGTDVAIIGTVTALTVFGTEGGVDAILAKIRSQALAVETDISTREGRQAVASLAYRIARSKTALDAMGKDLGEDNFRRWKAITAERARIRTELDALAEDVRKPLTDWEQAEKDRVAAHEAALAAICESPGFFGLSNASEDFRQRLAYLEAYPARDWQEFSKRAATALEDEIAKTKVALAAAEEREAAKAEAARIAREKAEQARRAREALIAENARREAEEKARLAAEAEARRVEAEREAAEAERARIARERQEASERADRAEADRLAATAKARADMERAAEEAEAKRKADVERATEAERQRIADAQAKDAAETARREANRRHRASIHAEARDALVKEGLSVKAATAAVTAIAGGMVPHITVKY